MKKIALISLIFLSACVAPKVVQAPVAPSGPVVASAVEPSYDVDTQSPRPGAMLTLKRMPAPFGYSDGAEAKGVAVNFCTNRNLRLSPDVLGHFVDPAWVFDEGCK